ncbi:MAG: hypothetical protein ACXVA2_21975 [Mucilaginibacter sp.]
MPISILSIITIPPLVSRRASDEIGQNKYGWCAGRGIAIVAEARPCANEVGQHFAARDSARFAGQRSGAAKKHFC